MMNRSDGELRSQGARDPALRLGLVVWMLVASVWSSCPGETAQPGPVPDARAGVTGVETSAWPRYAGPATLMLPVPYPPGWGISPLSSPGIDIVRITAPDGSAAVELFVGLVEPPASAAQVARTAIDNLAGASPEVQVTEEAQFEITGPFREMIRVVAQVGTRAVAVLALSGPAGGGSLVSYRAVAAPAAADDDQLHDLMRLLYTGRRAP
jgi:hypothetical protein